MIDSMEGSERAGATEDGYGKTEQLSIPDQRRSVRSMRMRASEGDSRAFSLPMHTMDSVPNRDAKCTERHRSNISFFLGGKAPTDDKLWIPNLTVVRATIRFALATRRLDNTI
ncbi:hypothetical protein CLAIMM_14383 [Cladophialophora immunda]|nr:hypothetical protein CLAIMM_14383 [Cladophialophora immunda]